MEITLVAPQSLEGQTLGKYRVLEALGRGGMAQVYRAYHPSLERYVAIKLLRSDLIEEEEFLARFRREARAVAALRHPHIVQVFDFDVQNDQYYMVMELLEGNTLKALLNHYRTNNETLPWGHMVRILLDVLDGLGYAHSEGITHRDIKPANIMLTRRGQGVLTDFGVAQIVGGTQYTVSGALMGTLHYMAPEQGLHGKCDSRSDLYSLGVVMYETLTGRPPFDADTPLAILLKHLNDPLPLPHVIDPSIPECLERVVLKALAKQPEERYPDAAAMAASLQQAAQEAGVAISSSAELAAILASASGGTSPQSTRPAAQPGGQPAPVPGPDTAERIAVYSGAARQNIPDPSFAADDTANLPPIELPETRTAAMPETVQGISPADLDKLGENLNGLGQGLGSFGNKFSCRLKERLDEHRPSLSRLPMPGIAQAVLTAVFLMVFINILAIFVEANGLSIFEHGWPMELTLTGMLLSAVMIGTTSPWLLVPIGILLGNGLLLGYYNFTGAWFMWAFLWPIELLLLYLSIRVPFWLTRQGRDYQWVIRPLGYLFFLIGLFASSLITGLAFIIALFRL